SYRVHRAITLAHMGDAARAIAAVNEVVQSDRVIAGNLYNGACMYGILAALDKTDAPMKDQYAAEAVRLLRRCKSAGLFRETVAIENMKKDTDLEALRPREDYQK